MSATAIALERPVSALTIGELQRMIAETVRQIVREETARDYYVNEDGLKVLYKEEAVAPEYLAQLQQDYEDIQSGRMPLVSSEQVLAELRQLGVRV